MTVADVFDALTSERPYKKAWPFEEAVAYLTSHSGRLFDPVCVRAFLEQIEEIRRVSVLLSDPGEGGEKGILPRQER